MNIKQLSRHVAAIERADFVAKSEYPEAALGDLTSREMELVRAVIRRCMSERRDNMIEVLRLEGIVNVEA